MSQKPIRLATSTSNFGVSRRENHDSGRFYARFSAPEISRDEAIRPWTPPDPFILGDSTNMKDVPDRSVALVVTSPPYFVGKEYEEALGEGHVPATYLEYLEMLHQVFAECKRKLEPGGRIAVNVANLGRKPYRSLSADVIRILEDELGLLLRGEVIWVKAKGSSGSCAWGSFLQAANPVLRDTTERVVIASKERFDRAIAAKERALQGLPHNSTMTVDEFMDATLDVWDIPPENASRVGHPAPFPVTLPERLIQLYTFEGDLVLDPFMGSGSTLVAASRTRRKYVGYDMDAGYVEIARKRVQEEGNPTHAAEKPESSADTCGGVPLQLPSGLSSPREGEDFQARASREGKAAQGIAESVLQRCGFRIEKRNYSMPGLGLVVNFFAKDKLNRDWFFDVSGAFTTPRAGLLRTDTLWKCLGRTLVLKSAGIERVILLTTHLPDRRNTGYRALKAAGPDKVFDAIEMLSDQGQDRLRQYAAGNHDGPIPGFWTSEECARAVAASG